MHHILVIGCGSIGERHVRTFLTTGRCRVTACDQSAAIRARIAAIYLIDAVADWEIAARNPAVTGIVIATPAPWHIPIGRLGLAYGKHLLIEKPLALAIDGCTELVQESNQTRGFVAIAYIHHLQPALVQARQFLHSGRLGMVRHVAIATGHHFPSARPAYREIYYRDHALGGGAIQDALTHLANSVEWVCGPATRVYCDAAHQVLEGVTVEDTVTLSARHGDVMASYSLNQFQAPNETRLDFHAETGSVRVDFHHQRWGFFARGDTDWTWHATPSADRDELFVAQANAFLDGCEGKPTALCTLEEGIQTLRFNLAALDSWRMGQPVSL